MTVFAWIYEDGYIWIAEDEDGTLRVWIDPTDYDKVYSSLTKEDWHDLRIISGNFHNIMANCEAPEDSSEYLCVIHQWHKMGSPRIDRKAPGYVAPVFPVELRAEQDAHERAARWIEENA